MVRDKEIDKKIEAKREFPKLPVCQQ